MNERAAAYAEIQRQKAATEKMLDGPFDEEKSLFLDHIAAMIESSIST